MGMLAPGKHITVEITYVTEVQIVRGDIFVFTYKTAFDKRDRAIYFNGELLLCFYYYFIFNTA